MYLNFSNYSYYSSLCEYSTRILKLLKSMQVLTSHILETIFLIFDRALVVPQIQCRHNLCYDSDVEEVTRPKQL